MLLFAVWVCESNISEPLVVIDYECRLRRCFFPSPRSEKECGRLALSTLPVDELHVELVEGLFSGNDERRLRRHQCAQQAGKDWFRLRSGDQGSFEPGNVKTGIVSETIENVCTSMSRARVCVYGVESLRTSRISMPS